MNAAALLDSLKASDPALAARIDASDAIEKEVQDCLFAVDLSIAFSPIVMSPGQNLDDAVEVSYKGQDGRYVIREPFKILKADEVKVARARFLVLNGKRNAPAVDRLRQALAAM